mgnify:FL=1
MDFTQIFTSLPFSVAVSVVLFYALFLIVRKEIKDNSTAIERLTKVYEQHIEYMRTDNLKNREIIKENTAAYHKLIDLLKALKDKFY